MEVKGYEVTRKPSTNARQVGQGVAVRDQTRLFQGATEAMGAGLVPNCDQEGGSAMEAELYGQELGNEGESLATTGKGALIGAQDFEEVIRDIDEAIQFGIKSSTPTEVNPIRCWFRRRV